MGNVSIRPAVHRQSLIPKYGLQIGEHGDKWEEEFIKNIDFSTMDNGEDWSSLFRYSKASDFDLSAMDSSNVTNMDYLFEGVNAGILRLNGLTVGPETTGNNMFHGTFEDIDFTGAKFYHIPDNMLQGVTLNNTLKLGTLDGSRLNSLYRMFMGANIPSVDLTGFNTSNVQNMSYMFYQASIPEIIGLKDINYSNVTTTDYMFDGYKGLIIDLSGVKFSSLTQAYEMFYLANSYAITQHEHLTIDLSNCYFPVIENASYMFYMSNTNPRSEDEAIDLILDGAVFKSNGLTAYDMFAYLRLVDNKGLDLSCMSGAKLLQCSEMFYSACLGPTDFRFLDFSQLNANSSPYVFRRLETPLVHINSVISLNATEINYFGVESNADEVIYEITVPPNIQRVYDLIWPNEDNQIFTIRNSDIHSGNWYNFIYSSQYPVKVVFENTTFHVGHGASFEYFAPCYANNGLDESYIDMSDVTIDGEIGSVRYMFGDPAKYKEIKFPRSGMKITGDTYRLISGNSYYDSNNKVHYRSPIYYNVDKFDLSEAINIQYVFCSCNGSFDLSGWNVRDAKRIQYIINGCEGDYNLSNWDTSKVQNLLVGDNLRGNLDIRNWDLTNATSIVGIYTFAGHYIDFDGWRINKNQEVTNCYLLSAADGAHIIMYLPDTVYKPDSYSGTMFSSYGISQYTVGSIVDVYTNATSIEEQGWTFNHIYTEEVPFGYRIHLGTTHDDFLNAIGGD